MSKLLICRMCNNKVSSDASSCPSCGDPYITQERWLENQNRNIYNQITSERNKIKQQYNDCFKEISYYQNPDNERCTCPVCHKPKAMKAHNYGSGYYYVYDCDCEAHDLFKQKYGIDYYDYLDLLDDAFDNKDIELLNKRKLELKEKTRKEDEHQRELKEQKIQEKLRREEEQKKIDAEKTRIKIEKAIENNKIKNEKILKEMNKNKKIKAILVIIITFISLIIGGIIGIILSNFRYTHQLHTVGMIYLFLLITGAIIGGIKFYKMNESVFSGILLGGFLGFILGILIQIGGLICTIAYSIIFGIISCILTIKYIKFKVKY